MGFFPTLCIYWPKRGGGDRGGGGDQPLSQSFCPSVPAAVTLGELCMCTHAHTRKSTHRSPGVRSFHREGGGEGDEGLEGEAEGGTRGGVGTGGEGTETRAPHLHQPGRRSILKAALSLHGRAGRGGGQGGSICGGQWSRWSTQGAPRYPVIHDNQREGEVGVAAGEREWRETKSERRRERGRGSDRENMEKLSCGQRALSWSRV